MPRDAGGNYTLPSGNPVISGTVIETSWANPTMEDLAAALTDSLSRSGNGNMLVPFRVPDGTAGSPSLSFLNNIISGLYLSGTNDVRVSVGGIDLARFEGGRIQQWDAVNMVWVDLVKDGTMVWENVWELGEYAKDSVVRDGIWTMIANKITSDRPAPQPSSPPEFALPDNPAWVVEDDVSVVISGQTYTFTADGWVDNLRVWVPTVTSDYSYRLLVADITNPSAPILDVYELTDLAAGQWNIVLSNHRIITSGRVFRIGLKTTNSSSNTVWTHPWLNAGVTLIGAPPATGSWNINPQGTILRVSKTDNDAVDQSSDLMVSGGTVFEFVDENNALRFTRYLVTGAFIDQGTYFQYPVSQQGVGSLGPATEGVVSDNTGTSPTPDAADYVELDNYWVSNEPAWADVEGFLEYDDVDQPGNEGDAFGVDINFTTAYVSPDWDTVAVSGGGGGSLPPVVDQKLSVGNVTNPLVDLKLKNTIDFTGVGVTSFTRASSGTYVDRYGVGQYSQGGSATNLLLFSEEFDNAAWSVTGAGASLVTDAIVAPNGTLSGDLLIGGGGTPALSQNIASANNVEYSLNVSIKAGPGGEDFTVSIGDGTNTNRARLRVNTVTGAVVSLDTDGNFSNSSASTEIAGDGWITCKLTTTNNAVGTVNARFFGGSGTAQAYVWGAQLEQSNFSNGYVPTTTTSATADVAGQLRFEAEGALFETGDALSIVVQDNYPATLEPFTSVSDFCIDSIEGADQFVYDSAATAQRSYVKLDSSGNIQVRHGSVEFDSGALVADTAVRITASYDKPTNVLTVFRDGLRVASGDAGAAFAPDISGSVSVGSDNGSINQLFGHVSRLQIMIEHFQSLRAQ